MSRSGRVDTQFGRARSAYQLPEAPPPLLDPPPPPDEDELLLDDDDDDDRSSSSLPPDPALHPLPAATMLPDVASVAVRYRFGGAWSDSWGTDPAKPLPDAVELVIARRDGTVFRELLAVGTGNAMRRGGGNAG